MGRPFGFGVGRFSRGGVGVQASLSVNLDFAANSYNVNGGTYSSFLAIPGSTFTRASQATMFDATGTMIYGPHNLITHSEDFTNAVWQKLISGTGVAPIVTANYGVAPDGTTTADRVQFNRGAGVTASDFSYIRFVPTATAGVVYSIYLKTADGSTRSLSHNNTGIAITITVTGEWQRFTIFNSAVAGYLDLRYFGTFGPDATADILAWGGQAEVHATARTYIRTSGAAVYEPRLDYDPVSLLPKGVLIEGARTNLLLQSEAIDNASWTKTAAAVTANALAAPSGLTTADKVVEDTSTGPHSATQSSASVAVGAFTASVFLKSSGRNACIWIRDGGGGVVAEACFDLTSGTAAAGLLQAGWSGLAWSITAVGGGWYRCTVTATADAALTGVKTFTLRLNNTSLTGNPSYTGDGTSGLYFWGAQLEVGASASSYIPTAGATVTRAADVAEIAYNYAGPDGTLAADYSRMLDAAFPVTRQIARISNAAADTLIALTNTGNLNTMTATSTSGGVFDGSAASGVISNPVRSAAAFGSNHLRLSVNGGAVTADANSIVTAATGFTVLRVGTVSLTQQLYGHIKRIRLWNYKLTDAELQAETA